MRVITIRGTTKTGKTTTVENIIRELKRRNYTVGSVKEIHFEKFAIDTEGTNTDRHKKAGASPVTARGMYETDVLFPKMLPMDKILSFYEQDFVVLEGVSDINAPSIVTATDKSDLDSLIDYRTFAISGVIANNNIGEYNGLPVINCVNDAARLVDLIEEKVPHLMPDFDAGCCTACGYDCKTLLSKILKWEAKREDCAILNADISLLIDGQPIKMVPFVQSILKNAVLGVVKELDGYRDGAKIEIKLIK